MYTTCTIIMYAAAAAVVLAGDTRAVVSHQKSIFVPQAADATHVHCKGIHGTSPQHRHEWIGAIAWWWWWWWNALSDILNLRTNSSGMVFACRLSNKVRLMRTITDLTAFAVSQPAVNCRKTPPYLHVLYLHVYTILYAQRNGVHFLYAVPRGLGNAAVHSSSTQHLFRMFRVHKKRSFDPVDRNQRHISSFRVENWNNVKSGWSFL